MRILEDTGISSLKVGHMILINWRRKKQEREGGNAKEGQAVPPTPPPLVDILRIGQAVESAWEAEKSGEIFRVPPWIKIFWIPSPLPSESAASTSQSLLRPSSIFLSGRVVK